MLCEPLGTKSITMCEFFEPFGLKRFVGVGTCRTPTPLKIFDLVPKEFPRMISIGRLDFMSEGLLLLTNNGDYSRNLELPIKGYERIYRVCIRGQIEKKYLEKINQGIKIDNMIYKKIKIKIDKSNKNYTWLIVKLREGKNREIRNICKYFSWQIVKLIRIQYGPYKLGDLKEGQIEEIKVVENV